MEANTLEDNNGRICTARIGDTPAAFLPALPAHQQRVVVEKRELDERTERLQAFFGTTLCRDLDDEERRLLAQQYGAMRVYSTILAQRLQRWGVPT